MRALDRILRGVLAVNFALFILSFIPAFSGSWREPGLFDRLWGNYRLAGWRADFVWMGVSTLFIAVVGATSIREFRYHKTTAILCLVWLACFLFYLNYCVHHMFG